MSTLCVEMDIHRKSWFYYFSVDLILPLFSLKNLTSIRCLKELTRPSDPLKLVYRISKNSPDKGTSCVVVHNVRKFHYFWRDLPLWLWNFDQYGKENVWNSVITTRRNLINSNFYFQIVVTSQTVSATLLKHWIVLW